MIQIALGWQNYHLHLFAKNWEEYGHNAKEETVATLAGLLPRQGGRMAYRYDFGDCWDHDIEVEKVHQAAKNTIYPRCPAGGRACPPEDSGGPEGFAEHLRVLRHKKSWKYRQARHIFGTGKNRWDPTAWDKAEVNAELAALAKRWADRTADQASKAAAAGPVEASSAPSSLGNGRPGNGCLRDGSEPGDPVPHSPKKISPETRPETLRSEIELRDRFRDDDAMSAPADNATMPAADLAAAPAGPASVPSNRIGYARISTRAQDHLSQMEALAAAHCREIVEETASTRKQRPKLRATVGRMRAGDTLVIYKPDRVARSVKELLVFLEDELAPRGINLHILTGICAGVHRPGGQNIADKMLFLVAAMAAEMERDLISERTLDGLAAAAAHGRKGGRPVTVTDDVLAIARARRARGESVTAIAKHLRIGRSTLYRAMEAEDSL
ncbi:MAG: DNA-invertase from lambdoid prophage e14 [Sphaerisporangium sp.]|nr:DNA-invertase from lambdoid prophage e14 [Sphaerisporangium sp.]